MGKPAETEEEATVEETEVEGGTAEETPAEDDPAVKALKILEGMQAAAATPKPKTGEVSATPTYADVCAKIKSETGWTDAQVDFHLRSLGEVSGPIQKQVNMMKLSQKFPDFKNYEADIEEELKQYPAASQGDPVLIEKVYYMAKGRKPASAKKNSGDTRIVADYPGFESGTERSSGKSTALTGTEKELARRMGISEDKWNKAKTTKSVRDLKD